MAYRQSELSALMKTDMAQAAETIARTWAREGTEAGTARALGCGRRSLQRWLLAIEAAGLQRPAARRRGRPQSRKKAA